ncbi:MAG: MFS transporter [Chromatiales bacterium]|nr:MFS transporter [Chromatiales bacterium]
MAALWKRTPVVSWCFFDWANSAYATTVMAGFFPVFFKQYWAGDLSTTDSTFWLGVANSLASIMVVFIAPLLGAIADRGGSKKRFLLFFTYMAVVMTTALFFVAQGSWVLALALYVLATLGFSGGVIFYDALLINVAEQREYDMVSALGYGFGYLGGGLLFSFNVLMTLFPDAFGLASAAEAVRYSFISVAVWWALFSLPLFLFVKEPAPVEAASKAVVIREGFQQLVTTFHQIRALKQTFLFLLAYWLYIDGVDTIVRMAVDYGLSIGFDTNGLLTALLLTQFVGFPAAILFGRLGEKRGPRQGIMLAIFVYLLVVLWAYQMEAEWEFYTLAVVIGLVQGGIQSLSRSLYARLIPKSKAGEFFGFYNMLGKFAAVLGPILMGWVGVLTGSSRVSILSISVLFILGAIILSQVDIEEGQRQAQLLDER